MQAWLFSHQTILCSSETARTSPPAPLPINEVHKTRLIIGLPSVVVVAFAYFLAWGEGYGVWGILPSALNSMLRAFSSW